MKSAAQHRCAVTAVLFTALSSFSAHCVAADEPDAAASAAPDVAAEAQAASGENASARVISASDGVRRSSGDGPSVELITGGSSKDGAASVGRLPVID